VVSGLACLTYSGFSSGLLFSVGVFLASSFHCVCVCVCICVCMAGLAHLVYLQERKNILTNVKECREDKLIWRVSRPVEIGLNDWLYSQGNSLSLCLQAVSYSPSDL